MSNRFISSAFSIILAFFMFIPFLGCQGPDYYPPQDQIGGGISRSYAKKILLTQERYTPKIDGDMSMYKGKNLYLMEVLNEAENTTNEFFRSPYYPFHYTPPGTSGFYTPPNVSIFFHAVFSKAATDIGMIVSDSNNPDLNAKALQLILLSISDEKFTIAVKLYTTNIPFHSEEKSDFKKVYTIAESRAKDETIATEILEKRIYRMVNKTISLILADTEFRKAFSDSSNKNNSTNVDIEDKLKKLNDLYKKGLITQDEYSQKKASLLDEL
jgi:hypothetical protein